jgi:tRNA (mo5U34)-methyltransferase
MSKSLQEVKKRVWFYEFDLPDGSRTSTDIPPDILPIHVSRRDKLRQIIRERVQNSETLEAIDFASHEGYYSIELSRHFKFVRGFEFREESLIGARLITDVLGIKNVEYISADLQRMEFDPRSAADFVLVYGLIYHLENPIQVIRLASQLCRKHLLLETQVFPYQLSGTIEDGYYTNERAVEGVFALTRDYSARREGGSTDIALVPSLNSVVWLLQVFGFTETFVVPSGPDDYEQFRRGRRVVIYAAKT